MCNSFFHARLGVHTWRAMPKQKSTPRPRAHASTHGHAAQSERLTSVELWRVPMQHAVQNAMRLAHAGLLEELDALRADELFHVSLRLNNVYTVCWDRAHKCAVLDAREARMPSDGAQYAVPLRVPVRRAEGGVYSHPWHGTVHDFVDTTTRACKDMRFPDGTTRKFVMHALACNQLLAPPTHAWLTQTIPSMLCAIPHEGSLFTHLFASQRERGRAADDVRIVGRRGDSASVRAAIPRRAETPQEVTDEDDD